MLRIYEHQGTVYIRDGTRCKQLHIKQGHQTRARAMLEDLDGKGRVRFITLKSILEER